MSTEEKDKLPASKLYGDICKLLQIARDKWRFSRPEALDCKDKELVKLDQLISPELESSCIACRIFLPHIIEAKSFTLKNDFEEALRFLNEAVPDSTQAWPIPRLEARNRVRRHGHGLDGRGHRVAIIYNSGDRTRSAV